MQTNLRLKQEIFNLCGMCVHGNTEIPTENIQKYMHTAIHTNTKIMTERVTSLLKQSQVNKCKTVFGEAA